MRNVVIILAIALVAVAGFAAWQVGLSEFAANELQDDMQDLASQPAARLGVIDPSTDEQLRATIVRKASQHGIELSPAQITVARTGTGNSAAIRLDADYTVPVNLFVTSFNLHFTPSVQGRQAGAPGVPPGVG